MLSKPFRTRHRSDITPSLPLTIRFATRHQPFSDIVQRFPQGSKGGVTTVFENIQSPSTRLSRSAFAKPLFKSLSALLLFLANAALLAIAAPAWGGLASSDVVVVVNGNSLNSRTLANHYVALRKIPSSNVIVLENVPEGETTTIGDFRKLILKPLFAAIAERKLTHIQCIAYSADFPTAINMSAETKPLGKLELFETTTGSINGLTFLYRSVLEENPRQLLSLYSNYYARRTTDSYFTSPAGAATQESWSTIEKLISETKHSEAADALEKLISEHPHQFPIAYLAAAQAALANDTPRALRLLKIATANGWNAGGYLANDKRFDSLRDNSEFQVLESVLDSQIKTYQPSVGFNSRIPWTPNGIAVANPQFGSRYVLSIVLGVTRGGGTTLDEAIAALTRASSADSTHPQGGFYFSLTKDVRTTTREPNFADAIAELQQMGYEAEVVKEVMPTNRPAVLGAQIGRANFDWTTSKSTLVPGSIAENLTSYGGIMSSPAGHTKLTELIKAGAAGSSGTVVEPYALQEKFPHPQMYVHYARGATLVEAFYLSVTGPYQLLIVGDPLCQPFSNAPNPKIDATLRILKPREPLRVEPNLDGPNYLDWEDSDVPHAQRTTPLASVAISQLFDNQNPKTGAIKPRIDFNVAGATPGYHEVCLRFVADDPLAQRSDTTIPIWLGDRELVELKLSDMKQNQDGKPTTSLATELLKSSVSAKDLNGDKVERVSLWNQSEQIGVAKGGNGKFVVRLDKIGMGPVRLQPKAELASGKVIQGEPIWIEVTP